MRTTFLRAADLLSRAMLAISELALVAMTLLITADVALRALFNAPIRGTYDAVGILLCASALFAVGHVILTRHEVVIDLIDAAVPTWVADGLKRFWALISVLMLGYILWAMIQPMTEARAYGDRSLELGLPMWLVWVMAMIGMAGALVAALAAAMLPPHSHAEDRAALEESGE